MTRLHSAKSLPLPSLLPLLLVCLLPAFLLAGCGDGAGESPSAGAAADAGGSSSPAPASAPEGAAGRQAAEPPLVLFLGDSLTAGYGLSEGEAFPARIDELLAEKGRPARVVNAGISGDTTSGGLARLDWLLRQEPDVVVVALGANDGLRGLPVAETEENLRRIVEACRDAGAEVVLAGMLIPPNYGPDYTRSFAEVYPRLAEELEVERIPFLLEGVAARPELNQPDGIHPNAEGQRRVARHVLPFVEEALERVEGS